MFVMMASASADGDPSSAPSRRTLRPLVAVGVVAVVVLAVLGWVNRPADHGGSVSGSPWSSSTIARVPVGRDPQAIAADDRAVWVQAGQNGSASRLWRIDAVTGRAQPLPNTTGAEWPAVGEGAAWVTRCTGVDATHPCPQPWVMKLDPASGATLASIALPGYAWQIATGLGRVWVSTEAGLVEIDPGTATIEHTFPVKTDLLGTADGSLWTTGSGYGVTGVMEIDPRSGRIVRIVGVHDACTFLASDAGVWVGSCQDGLPTGSGPDILTKIDPTSGQKVYTVRLTAWGELAFADGWLWMSRWSDGHVVIEQRDPATGRPTGVTTVVRPGRDGWSSMSIGAPAVFTVVSGGAFWLTHVDANDVVRVPIPSSPPSH